MKLHLSKSIFSGIVAIILLVGCSKKQTSETIKGSLDIIPLPVAMKVSPGSWLLDEETKIMIDSSSYPYFNPFIVFDQEFKKKSGFSLPYINRKQKVRDPHRLIKVKISYYMDTRDAYNIKVSDEGVLIIAGTELGVFYALQTLRQMMRLESVPDASGGQHRHWTIPYVELSDQPRFAYRGMHLDVSRHFMPVEFVKKYIDLLAYYKMNYFHWHLTDDQGWRIEILKYPKLQEIGAWRDETLVGHYGDKPVKYDGTRTGGFYTQQEIKDIVKYASERAVTIIPEIEMPGHAMAALASYPELACTKGPFKVATTWGVNEDVFCPSEATFTFLENVLDEVIALFPSKIIHIGGDEVPKKTWQQSSFCRDLMKKEGLKNADELQSYFIQRIEKYLNSKGKTIIGWDEILEGGLAPNATVMSWRGIDGGIAAAKAGHDVIMTPGSYCYFDAYQSDPSEEPLAIGGYTPIEKVYSFDPIPSGLSADEAKHILGGQGNVWTEYMATPEKVEYMAYPRAIALAEALWTPLAKKNWPDFAHRLTQQFELLDGMKVNYAKHLAFPTADLQSGPDGLTITWKTNIPDQVIYHARDTTGNWEKAKNMDKTLIAGAGSVFYKSDNTPTRRIDYNPSKSKNATFKSTPEPDKRYAGRQGAQTLGDGLKGNKYFNGLDWCGWEGVGFSIDIDFPEEVQVDSINIGTLSSHSNRIYPPGSIEIKSSTDHEHYGTIATWSNTPMPEGRNEIDLNVHGIKARYFRISVKPVQKIPGGSPGAGNPAWTFLDEVSIY